MSGGVMFVICIPTASAEQKLLGVSQTATPRPREYVRTDDNVEELQKSPLLAFQPTPKSHLAGGAAIQKDGGSREVLLQIENCPDEYDQQATVTSIDDIAIGTTPHTDAGLLKRTRSDNALKAPLTLTGTMESNGNMRKSWDGYIRDMMQSAKKLKSPQPSTAAIDPPSLNIENHASMEMVVREILKKQRIRAAMWQTADAGDSLQITFSVDTGYAQEQVVTMLTEWGIGERDGSAVSMVPCTVMMPKAQPDRDETGEVLVEQEVYDKTAGAWDRFMNSMRARLNVAQIVEGVKQDASITFDFLSLLIIAAVLAAFGLVENSTIFLASSMLISPLMGPIIAATFGTVIKDHQLTKFGIINELIGIFITTLVGFVFGLIFFNVNDSYSRGEGLTQEMLSRTDIHSLIVGIFIAIPSGAAVAISILGENIGSLVGVAISASLLPPAVNSGILWALAVMFQSHRDDAVKYNIVVESNDWSDHQAVELFVLGSISMAVTISNVICVYAAGSLFLKIKEVAPIVSREQRQFWKHDVKVARDYNNSGTSAPAAGSGDGPANGRDNASSLRTKRWVDEFGEFAGTDIDRLGLNAEMLRNIGRPAYQQTWSPRTLRHNQFQLATDSKRSLEDYEQLYRNMAHSHPIAGSPAPVSRHFSISGPSSKPAGLYQRTATSPPKYRSLLHDHIFNASAAAVQRRASMPYYMSISSPTHAATAPAAAPMATASTSTSCPAGGPQSSVNVASKVASRLSNIPELNSPGSLASSAGIQPAGLRTQTSAMTSASDEAHLKFEQRANSAMAARQTTGRKFIVTPAHDPLLDKKPPAAED